MPVADPLAAYVPRLLRERRPRTADAWWCEGTLLLADISGFTRLTDKLARAGRAGVEEMVTTVSSVFAALLDGGADGGDVLKFGGDALLLLYRGEHHAARACHAALAMQRTLREVGGIGTARGRVRLRMSVGIHTGRFRLMVCGAGHLELHVLGPDVTTTTRLEGRAGAGQVLVSAATARLLEGARLEPVGEGALALRGVGAVPGPPAARPGGGSLRRFVAPPLRDRLGDGGLEHEHRRATVAFARFGGIDRLLVDGAADHAFDRVQELTTAVMAASADYDVLLTATDVAADGGVFMLTAGAPDATGDEEARMLRVARRIVASDCGLGLRVGVNVGDVFVGPLGAASRRTYATMGDATNLAARVAGAAPSGRILATAAVLDTVRGRFDVEQVPPFRVRGKPQPVRAGLVGEATAPPVGATADSGPIVGRDDERLVLLEALGRARTGAGGVVEIIGAEGLGRSRLVAEVRRPAAGLSWHAVACEPFERTTPYHTARRLLRGLVGIPPAAGPAAAGRLLTARVTADAPGQLPWLPLVADVVDAEVAPTPETTDIGARFRRPRTERAVDDLVEALDPSPAVVVIEDASFMDDASAELIARLLGGVAARPWLVVVTRLADETGLHPGRGYAAHELALEPITPDEAAELARRLAERTPVPAHLLPELAARSEGNPLFLAELVAAQATADGTDDAALPRSVTGIIAARVDRLAPADRRSLRYLAVLGDRFDPALVDAALGPLGIHSADDGLWDRLRAFIRPDDDGWRFRTGLIRQVAYEALSFDRRRALHGRVADALPPAAGRSPLAVHLSRAERWDEAWEAAADAGCDAASRGANAVAGELFDLALTAAARLGAVPAARRREVAVAAGRAWQRAGVVDRALRAYTVAGGLATTPAESLAVLADRAGAHAEAGRVTTALRLYGRVLSATRDLPPGRERERLAARAHSGYATGRLAQGRAGDAVEHAHASLRAAGAAGDRAGRARAHHLLDRAYTALDDHTEAARQRDAALPLFAAEGDLPAQGTVLFDLGSDAKREGRLEEALWFYDRSREARERAGDVQRGADSANARGEVLAALGRRDEAAAAFAEALRAWRGARSRRGIALASANLGDLAVTAGDPEGGLARLEEAARLAADVGAGDLLARIRVSLAAGLVGSGRVVEAWELATDALASGHLDPADRARAHRLRAEALELSGSGVRAAEELAAAGALSRDPQRAERATAIRP